MVDKTKFGSLLPLLKQSLTSLISFRDGEQKIGELLSILDLEKSLEQNLLEKSQKCKFAVFGIPEDLGPRANMGRGGSTGAYQAFLSKFVNVQSNQFLNGEEILILGHINCSDLQEKTKNTNVNNPAELKELRDLVAEIDERVIPVVQQIVKAGMTPIAIGGGHNNSYGMIKGYASQQNQKINAINIDPHADFRGQEGRHSGNGFSYAYLENHLNKYNVLALHESYNNSEILQKAIEQKQFTFQSFDDILRGEFTFEQALQQGIDQVIDNGRKCGIEIDLDCIEYMPTSAFTPSGVSSSQIRMYINQVAKQLNTAYLHIAEGAPELHPDGKNIIGKMVAYIVCDFIKMRNIVNKQ